MQIVLPDTASIELDGTERLGWTSEQGIGHISFEYDNAHDSLFRNVPEGGPNVDIFPETGQISVFETITFPGKFSIGAIIETGEGSMNPCGFLPSDCRVFTHVSFATFRLEAPRA